MSPKVLIAFFYLANMVDIMLTSYYSNQAGWQELNCIALLHELPYVILIKLGLAMTLAISYAVAVTYQSRLEYVLRRTLQWGGGIMWAVQAWNLINIVLYHHGG